MDKQEDNNFTEKTTEADSYQLTLTDLPTEVFLNICSFLDAATLVHRLSLVCKQFFLILRDDSLWKSRISRIWPHTRYPIIPEPDEEYFWQTSCVAIEKEAFRWRKIETMEQISIDNAHYTCIDSLLLMNKGEICLSGGRDRTLVCTRLTKSENESKYSTSKAEEHEGWIWDITSLKDRIYTCSWDKRIHEWDITNGSDIILTERFPLETMALLCMTSNSEQNLLATGSYCKSVSLLDPRSQNPLITRYKSHQLAVISIAMNSRYIISASEDKHVSIWDLYAGKKFRTILLANNSYPMSLFMDKKMTYAGDSNANVHILDISNGFEPIKTFKTDHTKGIIKIYATPGSLITGSLDSKVRISSPTDPLNPIASIECYLGEIASMDYCNDVLAVSGESIIKIWRPNDE